MDLYISTTSPYARKARVVVREKGMPGWVNEIEVKPFEDPITLHAASPVAKVPALVEGGRVIEDSPVICAYLDSLARPHLEPSGALAWDDRTRGALGDAISDAAVALRLEQLRAEDLRSDHWLARHRSRVKRIVGGLAPGAAVPTLGDISIACALAYLDLRHADLDWRALNRDLAAWHEGVEARTAFQQTAFAR